MSRQREIVSAVKAWPGVHTEPHRFGGVEFKLGTREIGHIHGDWLVDIPFTNPIRAQLVAEGKALDHHIYPGTALISFYLRSDNDVTGALWLLKLSYLRTLILLRKRNLADETTAALQVSEELERLHLTEPLQAIFNGLLNAAAAENQV